MHQPLYQIIASAIGARDCCGDDNLWGDRWETHLNYIADNLLPSGSGIDSGTAIDWVASSAEKVVLHIPFHHMHESGMYDGWTDYTMIIKPSLCFGFELTIPGGRDRNETKDYLADLFHDVLSREYVWTAEDTLTEEKR